MAAIFRKLSISLAVVAVIAAVAAGLMWWSIHSSWFVNLVRTRVVATLQSATGGKVELGAFSFNPDTLAAKLSNLVIHGNEPKGAPPLFTLSSAEIDLKLLSVWRRELDVQAVIINEPRIYVLVNADGSTNIPHPRHRSKQSPIEQLLNLKVKQLSVSRGVLVLNNRRFPLHFATRDLGLLLDYNYLRPSYGVSFQTQVSALALGQIIFHPMRIEAKGRLFKGHADVDTFKLVTEKGASTVTLAGKIGNFAHPFAEANVLASLSIDELAQLPNINDFLRNGRATASGVAHFDVDSAKFSFNGKGRVSGVDFVTSPFTLRNISGDADILADNKGMLLHHAHAMARGVHFTGEASIKNYSYLLVDCHVADLTLPEVGSYLTNQPFPWSGSVHGIAHVSARLTDKTPDFNIDAQMQIDPGAAGIPTSGSVDVGFKLRKLLVAFGSSTLQLAHSSATFQGTLDSDLQLSAQTSDLADLHPLIPILSAKIAAADLPAIESGGSAHFDGSLHDLLHQALVKGSIGVNKFKFRGYDLDTLTGQFAYSADALSVSSFQLKEADASLSGSGSIQLVNWLPPDNSPAAFHARFTKLNIAKAAAMFGAWGARPVIQGVASGDIRFNGTPNVPHALASIQISNLDAYGEQLNRLAFDAALDGNKLQINRGRVQSGPAMISFAGRFQRSPKDWSTGDVDVSADSNGFPLASLFTVKKFLPTLKARAEVHVQAAGKLLRSSFKPLRLNGSADFSGVSVGGADLGGASIKAVTQGNSIAFTYSGDLRETRFQGAAEARLSTGTPLRGSLKLDRIGLTRLKEIVSKTPLVLPVDGFVDGSLTFDGLLEEPAHIHAQADIKDLQLSAAPSSNKTPPTQVSEIVLHNNAPILVDLRDGRLSIIRFELDGRDTSIKLSGSAPLFGAFADKPLDIKAAGTADLALFALFDPNVRSSGNSELAASITGTATEPNVAGTLQLRNGSFFMSDLPNGLSDVNGTVLFSRNRATIQQMSAHSGGGDLSLSGSLSFGQGSPLVYHLEAQARNVRVRYANSISVTANSDLRLSGTSASSILSGTLTVNRVVFTSNADAGNLIAAAGSAVATPADQGDFLSGVRLDVAVESAPNLQVSTNLSRDLEAEIQLHLRGTPDHPSVLGSITANQGDLKIFGTRFSLNRGEVSFVNAVRVEPVLNLDLETQARGVTVNITVSGTASKLNFNYRSDPPLQPRDIIALLTVGRAPDLGTTGNAQTGNDVGALSAGVNTALGQAISPVSNRLSKLFGVANIRIDPYVQSITNTPQARLSVEQQISRNVTVTYVTNLSQTSEQIFRFEWSLGPQFSIVALRDDNGEFGIDFQYKKRFK